jgi:hypothetical protein
MGQGCPNTALFIKNMQEKPIPMTYSTKPVLQQMKQHAKVYIF